MNLILIDEILEEYGIVRKWLNAEVVRINCFKYRAILKNHKGAQRRKHKGAQRIIRT